MPLDDLKERTRAIDLAVGQIEKQFGKGSIMRLGQRGAIAPMESISTGSISIDYALGIGGLPRGRVVEIFGPESSGKTTLALQVIAEAQKTGGMAAVVDAEHALDAAYAQKLGVDTDTSSSRSLTMASRRSRSPRRSSALARSTSWSSIPSPPSSPN